MSDLITTAKLFYRDALSDPVSACDEFLSQDFVLENYLPQHFPFGGRYEGASGFLQYLGEISSAIEMGPLHMDEWVTDGNVVVVRGTEESLVKSTGRKYSMSFVHWLTFNDLGRITIMKEFNDTAEMAKAFDQ
jgi:ketosteroid isomerase-like protein